MFMATGCASKVSGLPAGGSNLPAFIFKRSHPDGEHCRPLVELPIRRQASRHPAVFSANGRTITPTLPRQPPASVVCLLSVAELLNCPGYKGSLKNNFTFHTPMHLLRLRCESSEYPDIPAFSRFSGRALQRLKL